MDSFRYPCTGRVEPEGFTDFLKKELGPDRANLAAFANELGSVFGPRHITLVNSGSSANLAAALALAEVVGRGAHAVTAGITFPTTLSALLFAGFEPTLVDIEPGGFGIDPDALVRALRPGTRLICVTHFLGFPAQLEEVMRLAAERDLLVLQDCCESATLLIGGQPAWTHGSLATWSFYHPHHISSYGGGAVIALDEQWRDRVESISHWGRACSCHYDPSRCRAPGGMHHNFHYIRPGLNLEMSELNACFGRFQLRTFAEQEARRRRHYAVLYEALCDLQNIKIHPAPEASGSPFAFPVTLKDGTAEEAADRLHARGVEVRNLVGGVATSHPAFHGLPHDGLTRARSLCARSFLVGVHQTLAEDKVRAVASILRDELGQ